MKNFPSGPEGAASAAEDGSYSSRFLNSLPIEVAKRLIAQSTHMDLPVGTPIFKPNEHLRYGYILTSGMVSVVYTSVHGNSIELSMIGDEGPIGWLALLGPMKTAAVATVQVSGAGYRIPMPALRQEFETEPAIHARVLEFAQYKALNSYQITACNRLHRARERFSRWLLMVTDRSHKTELALTQEFLADMLGTRRTTVAEEAGALQSAGAIEYSRGLVRILDRKLLEAHACECYGIIKGQFDSLYNLPAADRR